MKLSTIRTLRGRIVVFFVLLMLVVQVGVLGLTSSIGESIARRWIAEELTIGERVFERLLAQNTAQLLQGARILAADFAFREAIATRDTETIASALRNHGARMGAHVTLLIDRERTMTADRGEPPADAAPIAELIDVAMRERSAAALARLDGRLHQLVVVPVMAPLPIGWVALGFAVDDRVAQDLQRLTGLQVSFVGRRDAGDWSVDASTLDSSRRHALLELVADADPARQALLRQGRADIDGHLALRASAGS
ncbi:MAG TPA: cache domain-containing protein, partial [Burkholderiaceae bacterium]|nr:cache domain-containing protein [Burkholderiaceae bacterium]